MSNTLNSKQQSLSMGNSSQRVWWLSLRDLRKGDHEEEGGTAVTGTWAVIFTTLRHTHNFSVEELWGCYCSLQPNSLWRQWRFKNGSLKTQMNNLMNC